MPLNYALFIVIFNIIKSNLLVVAVAVVVVVYAPSRFEIPWKKCLKKINPVSSMRRYVRD
jgi:hypothetical protein